MNYKSRKTALLIVTCSLLSPGCRLSTFAASPSNMMTMAPQTHKITGTILESAGPIVGATVKIKGSQTGTVSDLDGHFSIDAAPGDILEISYIGYGTKDVKVGDQKQLNITLSEDNKALDEVVVVGYGVVRKHDLTGAVSTINGKDLDVMSSANVVAAMAGRTAGIRVVPSGSVDGSTKIRIRGIGTINNSDPLYVVDGFPTGDISYLAPSDIKSVEVLKDASASAIYGSRGANGVVMITTQKGAAQPTKINANAYIGFSNASKKLDVLNATDYAKARLEAYSNAGMSMSVNDKAILDFVASGNYQGTDWQDQILRTGVVQNYNVSVNGGSEKEKYNLSATYNSDEGVLKNSFVNKVITRFNNEYKFSNAVTMGTDISFTNYQMSNIDTSNMYGSALTLASRAAPVSPVYDQNGNWAENMAMDNQAVRVNAMEKYKEKSGNKFVGNLFLNIDLMKDLSFRSTYGIDYSTTKLSTYNPVYYVSAQESNSLSSLQENRYSSLNWVWSNVLNYNLTLAQIHRINAMVGVEATYNQQDMLQALGYDIQEDPDMRYLSAAKSNQFTATSAQEKSSIFSTFFRVNYSLLDRYLVTATIRSDASSKFAKNNRVGYFPSVALGWNAKEENFLKNVDWISMFKVRAGWGQVGNQSSAGVGDYISRIANGFKYVLDDNVYEGRIPEYMSNPNLKWEISEQSNLGLDLSLFSEKLGLNLDYFNKKTKDMIVRVPVPLYFGAKNPLVNVGTMQNSGFEFTVNHHNNVGKFVYDISYNMSFVKNKVLSLGQSGAIDATVYDSRLANTSRTEVGHEIAYYYGYKTDGIFNTQEELDAYSTTVDGKKTPIQPNAQVGDVKFVDLNKDGKIDASDLTYLGSYMPDFTGGLNISMSYEGFDMSVFSDFSYGAEIANMTTYDLRSSLMNKNILSSYYQNRWTPDTPNNNQPRLTASAAYKDNAQFSDRYIESGNFFRIRNIQLGYTLPKAISSKLYMTRARLYVSIDNLVTFTKYSGYNPDISDQWNNVLAAGCDVGGAPLPRTFSFGFNITF